MKGILVHCVVTEPQVLRQGTVGSNGSPKYHTNEEIRSHKLSQVGRRWTLATKVTMNSQTLCQPGVYIHPFPPPYILSFGYSLPFSSLNILLPLKRPRPLNHVLVCGNEHFKKIWMPRAFIRSDCGVAPFVLFNRQWHVVCCLLVFGSPYGSTSSSFPCSHPCQIICRTHRCQMSAL